MPMTDIPVAENTVATYLAEPSGAVKGGIVLIHEVWGLDDHMKDVADRLVAEGYVVMAPNLLQDQEILRHADKLQADIFNPVTRNEAQPRLRELMAPLHDDAFVKSTVTSLKACYDSLSGRDDVKGRVGVIGFCFGGTYAYQLAAEEPLLKAAVPFYGHAPLRDGKLDWITCPVLAFYGERDENLMKQLPAVEDAMGTANVDFTAKVYDNAGHAFFNDTNEFAYNADAAQDAWLTTLDFLDRHVAHADID